VDITSHSHEAVKGHSWLSIHPAMAHSHPPGWDPKSVPEIYAFADYVLKNGAALPMITQEPFGTNLMVKYASSRPITKRYGMVHHRTAFVQPAGLHRLRSNLAAHQRQFEHAGTHSYSNFTG